MAAEEQFSLDLAEAVLDGRPLDWALEASTANESQRALIAQFQAVAGIASFGLSATPHRSVGDPSAPVDATPEPLTWGPLTIFGRIGRGSFGDVYRARDPKLDRPVALKLLRHRDHRGDVDESAAIDEGRLMARVRHPNVVTVYGAERIEGRVGLWMQLVEGRTLEEELAERGPLPEGEVARIGLDLCGALAAIHRAGLLHRDLKAQNVLRDADGQVLVTDFGAGLALADIADGETNLAGTPLYLAPEALMGEPATARSDIYSLGVLLYHLATASYPVTGRTVAEIREAQRERRRSGLRTARPDLTDRFAQIVDRALEFDPDQRFESAGAMEGELAGLLAPTDMAATDPAGVSMATRWSPVVGRLWATAAVLAIAVATTAYVNRGAPPAPSVVNRQLPLTDWMESGGPSADGRLFSFVDDKGNLAVFDLTTGEIQRLTDNATFEGDAQYAQSSAVSADGRFVAVAWWAKDGKYELRVVEVEGKGSRVLLRSDAVDVPVPVEWSRTGDSILSILTRRDHTNQLALVSVADGGMRTVKELGTVMPQHASLSPDGEFVVYDYPQEQADSARDIFIIRRDGSEERRLIEFPATDIAPVWAPDGRHVVFASDRSGAMDLWSIAVEGSLAQGEPEVIRRNIGRMLVLGITDTGSYYYHQTVGAVDVYVAPLEGEGLRTPTPISSTYSGSNISSLWSPDGRRLAFASRRGPSGFTSGWTAIAIRDLETQAQRELMPAMNMFLLRSWSPDGRKILVQGEDAQGSTGAHAIETRTGVVTPIVLNERPTQNDIRRPDWRPDGSVVYVNSGSQKLLSRAPRSGGEQVLVDLKSEGLKITANIMGRGFKLSLDGQTLAYTVNARETGAATSSLWVRPLNGGVSRQLAHATAPETLMFQDWTPDGSEVLFTRWNFESPKAVSLWRVSIDEGEPQPVGLAREGLRDISVSPDGSRITFTAGWPRAEIWGLENLLTPLR